MAKTITAVLVLLAAALPAGADIALFTDGRSMKIAAYKVVGESEIQLTLRNGGRLTMPLERVDRIVDDEVVPVDVVAEVKKAVEHEGIFPKRSWRYDEKRGPIFKSKYDKLIVEAQDEAGDPFGFDQLEALLASAPDRSPSAIRDRILDAVARHSGTRPADDDRTVMVLRFENFRAMAFAAEPALVAASPS